MERTYLSTENAAQLLGLSPRTLEKWRVTGGGPVFVKLGRRVAYQMTDVERWIETQRRRSTSDPGAAALT